MRFFWAAAAVMLVCGVARAEGPSPEKGDAATGVGIICNTSAQAEQFVKLSSTGIEPDQAMRAVNADARDHRACGVAALAYIRNQTVDTMKLSDQLVQTVRINVVAGFNGTGWQLVSGMVQYRGAGGRGRNGLISFPDR